MSKILYVIAVALLAVWAVCMFAFAAEGWVYITLVAGLVALLFAVIGTVVEVWCSTIKNMLD
jgi:hypothetical protein